MESVGRKPGRAGARRLALRKKISPDMHVTIDQIIKRFAAVAAATGDRHQSKSTLIVSNRADKKNALHATAPSGFTTDFTDGFSSIRVIRVIRGQKRSAIQRLERSDRPAAGCPKGGDGDRQQIVLDRV